MIEDHALITCSIDTGDVTELEIHTVFGVSEDANSPQIQTSAEADGAPAAFAKLVADSASLVSRLDRREEPSESAVPTHTGGLERHSRDEDEESIGNLLACGACATHDARANWQICHGLRRRPGIFPTAKRLRTARRSVSRTNS
jgi:hypothetical protein